MSLLDLKLLRDLRALKSQALAVALVMACGLAMMIMTRSLILSLDTARTGYYERHRFAEVFSSLKRAPKSVAAQIAALPGVAAVEASVAMQVTLDIPGMAEPATGLINSLPDRREPILNRPYLRTGRLPGPGARNEALVSEAFSDAHHLRPGDSISAILNGRKVTLRIAGIVLSPQFVFEAAPGAALPDNRSFGVFWMREEELAEAFNLEGAFNTVALTLAPGASERAVIAAVDRVLEPFGSLGAHGRKDHPSDVRVTDEIRVLKGLSFGFPLVFLSVAAFMTNAVMGRQIALQREQIAILKAFGFTNRQIGLHFVKFALVIVVTGTLAGVFGGWLLGRKLVDMYLLFFRFPALDFQLATGALVAAALASSAAALVGVIGAVRRVAALSPAEAMRPEPPASFRPAFFERIGVARWFGVSFRMSLRNIERKPVQAALTCAALALATGILVIPNSFRDGINHILNFQWDVSQRQTVTLSLVEPGPLRALADFRSLPGVVHAESFRSVPVELRTGSRSRRLAVSGIPADSHLARVIDANDRRIILPPQGVVLSKALADNLGLKPGDSVILRVLQGKRPERSVPVVALAEDFAGVAAYMDMEALNRLLGEGDRLSGARLTVAAGRWSEFLSAVKNTPQSAGVVVKEAVRASFRRTTAESIGLIQMIYLTFATAVAFGIVYNSARISLSERARELATLRVLGFTRGEVGSVLVGELVILTLVALPAGLVLGSFMAKAILVSVNTETVRLPLILTPSNYAFAVLVVATATAFSAALACRRLNQLDLVGALKAID
ncbi:MAG: transporter permease [Rariglobus sp.]|jgi:putative ABC transport system permease protein|nr:transporter permease [Rariglobus sp.]